MTRSLPKYEFEFGISVISIQFDKNVITQSPYALLWLQSKMFRGWICFNLNVSITVLENLLDLIFRLKIYHLIFGYGLVKLVLGLKVLFLAICTRTIQFEDCVNSSHILLDLTCSCLYIKKYHHWVCYIIGDI